jgi:hypothetical protein
MMRAADLLIGRLPRYGVARARKSPACSMIESLFEIE